MTPRERAEALGWVRWSIPSSTRSQWWWDAGEALVLTVVCPQRGAPGSSVIDPRTGYLLADYPTEDEALEHALLLLDVWLS